MIAQGELREPTPDELLDEHCSACDDDDKSEQQQ
jgi:hypothetical protein